MNCALSPLNSAVGPGSTFDAATRCSLIAERKRAKTASPISVRGVPSSRAVIAVHLPVPFLAGDIEDLAQQRRAIVVLISQDLAGDFDQEGFENAFVPAIGRLR